MNRKSLIFILFCLLSLSAWSQEKHHSFTFGKNDFLLNENPFQIISGEMHPARIPVEYWQHRIQMAKAMGCNTIAAYIFWNYHESKPGVFDFNTENRNIRQFIKIAQKEGMWVLFRPGPYVCAEWDFGGLPSYLLSIPDIKIRCMDPRYLEVVERYITALATQIKDLQVTKGGPILMVQIENEYGSYGNDRNYLLWLKNLWRKNGIEVSFYTADGATPYMLEAGTLPGAAIGLDSGVNEANFEQSAKHNSIVSLPICNIVLKAIKPERKPYPKELITYGDHLRKKRLDLNLSQPQVAKIINVTTDSITNWELNRNEPNLNQIPKIISFLEYTPIINENPIKKYRLEKGLSQKELAEILKIDPTTLSRIERGSEKMSRKVRMKLDCLLLYN